MQHQLAHEFVGPADAPDLAFVLHGILGSRRNWGMFTRSLVRAYPGWRFALIDLRGHGESDSMSGPHTVRACAADLDRLAEAIGRPRVVIGHSFGGKVALVYARDHGIDLTDVWALDSSVGLGSDLQGQGVIRVIEVARAMPIPAPDRPSVIKWFRQHDCPELIARWMTTNVVKTTEHAYEWRFDLEVVEALLADYWHEDLWPFLEHLPYGVTAHILRAGLGDRWSRETVARLESLPGVHSPVLANAGHWVHVDDAAGLRDALGLTLHSA